MTPDTRTALETLLKECRTVLGFAQSWQPLTPGDLSDLRRAVDAASALLSTSPGEPEDETCETCGMPITGPTVRTRDDVPLCEACADDFAREKPVGPQPIAPHRPTPTPCIGRDPLCPCQDGDSCHYRDTEDTKAWPIPETPS